LRGAGTDVVSGAIAEDHCRLNAHRIVIAGQHSSHEASKKATTNCCAHFGTNPG